jgi:NADPH:quinone reductase-like Zn-dependent oxidoreductase
MGAEVTAVGREIEEDLLRRFGADGFIDYQEGDFGASDRRYDVVFDVVAGSSCAACLRGLEPQGRYRSGNPRLCVMIRSFPTNWFGSKEARFAFARETTRELVALKEMIEAGSIRSIVDRVYPMEEASEAQRRVEAKERRGAVGISIGGPCASGRSVSGCPVDGPG